MLKKVSLREKGVDLNLVAVFLPARHTVSLREKGVDLNVPNGELDPDALGLPS